MPRIKDQAICIRLIDFSESSQVVALLTEQHGLVRGLAKGSKRMSPGSVARFSGGIELLTLGQIVATTRPSRDLATLTEWDLQEPYWHLHEDLDALHLAMYAADAAHAMLAEHDPHPEVFTALGALFERLENREGRDMALLCYQWSLLDACGYRPQLEEDVVTNEPLEKRSSYHFDPHLGGFAAEGGAAPDSAWGVRRATLEQLQAVAAGDENGSQEAVRRANRLLCAYLRALLDRQLPTMARVLNQG